MLRSHARRASVLALLGLHGCPPRQSPPRPVHDTPDAVATTVAPRPRDACTDVSNALGVRLPRGFCLRAAITGLLKPRHMVVAPDGSILVAESGAGWRRHRGRVSVLRPQPDGTLVREALIDNLDRPHGIALSHGTLFIAEAGRIVSLPYPSPAGAAVTPWVEGLPDGGRHPHKTLGLGPDGALYFSVGSATDSCAPPASAVGEEPCVEAQRGPIETARAGLFRLDLTTHRVTPYAFGLRNALGLAWHVPSGRMWAVENGRDYIDRVDASLADALLPHEELNEIRAGHDYGWPYCYDANARSPEYASSSVTHCGQRVDRPTRLLPPHAAPLDMVFYDGGMFPEAWRARAFIAYHGYRAEGHRIVSLAFSPQGDPVGDPEDFVSGWEERTGRPHGHLAGLVVGRDGALYVSDDVGGAVYRIAWGESAMAASVVAPTVVPAEPETVVAARCAALASRTDALSVMQREVIDARCVVCHASAAGGLTLRRCDARTTWESLAHGRSSVYGPYVVAGRPEEGVLAARLRGDTMGPQMPMQGAPLSARERGIVEQWIAQGARSF